MRRLPTIADSSDEGEAEEEALTGGKVLPCLLITRLIESVYWQWRFATKRNGPLFDWDRCAAACRSVPRCTTPTRRWWTFRCSKTPSSSCSPCPTFAPASDSTCLTSSWRWLFCVEFGKREATLNGRLSILLLLLHFDLFGSFVSSSILTVLGSLSHHWWSLRSLTFHYRSFPDFDSYLFAFLFLTI